MHRSFASLRMTECGSVADDNVGRVTDDGVWIVAERGLQISARGLRRGNPEPIIRQVALGNTSIVDPDLASCSRYLNPRRRRAFGAYLDPFRDFAAFEHYGEWDFRPGIAQVLQGHGEEVDAFFGRPWMHRLHTEIGKAAVLINPVVEKPAQVALGGGFDQSFQVLWILVIVVPSTIL